MTRRQHRFRQQDANCLRINNAFRKELGEPPFSRRAWKKLAVEWAVYFRLMRRGYRISAVEDGDGGR